MIPIFITKVTMLLNIMTIMTHIGTIIMILIMIHNILINMDTTITPVKIFYMIRITIFITTIYTKIIMEFIVMSRKKVGLVCIIIHTIIFTMTIIITLIMVRMLIHTTTIILIHIKVLM